MSDLIFLSIEKQFTFFLPASDSDKLISTQYNANIIRPNGCFIIISFVNSGFGLFIYFLQPIKLNGGYVFFA